MLAAAAVGLHDSVSQAAQAMSGTSRRHEPHPVSAVRYDRLYQVYRDIYPSLAPLFALSMAHVFSDALDLQIRKGRRLTNHDRRHLLAANLQYMYIAIPPIVLIVLLSLFHMPATDVIRVVLVLGLLSLGWWGYYAGRKAGVPVLRRWIFALNYSFMGAVVIGIELLLTH